MSFLIKNDQLLKKYGEIWSKINNTMQKGIDSEPLYNGKNLKLKSYGKKTQRKLSFVCLSIIAVESVCKINKN